MGSRLRGNDGGVWGALGIDELFIKKSFKNKYL